MRTTFISTSGLSGTGSAFLAKLEAKLAEAQKEVTTGRLADVGAGLGYRSGESVSLRQEHARLTAITASNASVSTRLDATQGALKGLVQNAQSFLEQMVAARTGNTGPQVIQAQAQSALSAFADTLNTTVDGAYLFAGINADVKPITDYNQQPPPANAQAVANAFATAFGFPQSDPGTAAIAPAYMQTFLDGAFADLFDPTSWASTWSAASDQNVRSRIATSELTDTSVNANAEPFRKLASAYTMLADLGTTSLSHETYQTVVDTAVRTVGDALNGLTGLQAHLGTAQERVKNANERMSLQMDIMTTQIGALEGVDPYEAATKVSSLMTQIEAAYAMTARLQKLTLLNYLPVA